MHEPRRVPPPGNDAHLLARDTRFAALAGNGGVKTLLAAMSRRGLAITRLEADGCTTSRPPAP